MGSQHKKHRLYYLLACVIIAALGVYGLALYLFPVQSGYKSLLGIFGIVFIILSAPFIIFKSVRHTNKIMRKNAAARGQKISQRHLITFWALMAIGIFAGNRLFAYMNAKDLSHIGIANGVVSIPKKCTSINATPYTLEAPDEKKILAQTLQNQSINQTQEYAQYLIRTQAAKNTYIAETQKAKKLDTSEEIKNISNLSYLLDEEKQKEIHAMMQSYCTYIGIRNNTTFTFIKELYKLDYELRIPYAGKFAKIQNDHKKYTDYLNALHKLSSQSAHLSDVVNSLVDFLSETKDQHRIRNGKLYFQSYAYRKYQAEYLNILKDATEAENKANAELASAEKILKAK